MIHEDDNCKDDANDEQLLRFIEIVDLVASSLNKHQHQLANINDPFNMSEVYWSNEIGPNEVVEGLKFLIRCGYLTINGSLNTDDLFFEKEP